VCDSSPKLLGYIASKTTIRTSRVLPGAQIIYYLTSESLKFEPMEIKTGLKRKEI